MARNTEPQSESCCSEHHLHSGYGCEQTLDELEFEKSIFGCAVYGDLDRLKQIVSKKGTACLNEKDRNGYTCLHYAVRHSRIEMCRYLVVLNRVDVNAKTKSCLSTPLHRACYVALPELVELLLTHGARPLERDCDGKTPLHKCVEELSQVGTSQTKKKELEKCAKILINKSGKEILYLKDSSGKSSIEIFPDLLEFVD